MASVLYSNLGLYFLCDDRIVHVARWYLVCLADELGRALKVAASRIPCTKKSATRLLVGDGAAWLWKACSSPSPEPVRSWL